MEKRSRGDEVTKPPIIAAAEEGMKKLDRKLREGTNLELGQRGSNKVSAMAEQFSSRLNKKEEEKIVPLQKSNSRPVLNLPSTGGSEICHFCRKRVYLMERLSAEGLFFHRGCFKCEYCKTTLRLGNYAFERDGSRFFCMPHFGLAGLQRWKIRRRSEELETADKENIPEPRARTPSPTRSTVELAGLVDLESELDARGTTPERVEFENLAGDVSEEEGMSEMDEDEWTDRNFGASAAEMGSSDSNSDLSDSEEEVAGEVFVEAMEQPLTLDQTRQLAESWTRRYSKSVSPGQNAVDEDEDEEESASDEYDESDEEFSYEEYDNEEDDSETATEGEEEIRARELRKQEVKLNVPDPPPRRNSETASDTEVGSEEETSSESESSEEDDSATEIETDPEFDDDKKLPSLSHHAIPTILINSKGLGIEETESRSASLTNLHAENNGVISLRRSFPRPPIYRQELLNRTHSTEGIASKLSLELKKKYLLGGSGSGNNVKKSGSASVLDSKFKSFVNMISEHQKLLNPAPQPSPSMQAFLEGTAKLRTNPLSPPSSISPVAQLNKDNEKESIERSKELSKTVSDQSAINGKSDVSTDAVIISRLCGNSDRDKNINIVNGVCDIVNNAKENVILTESKSEQPLITDQNKIESYNSPLSNITDSNRGCEEMEVKNVIIVDKTENQLVENLDDVRPRSPAHETSIIVPELKPRLESVDSCKDSLSESDSLSFGEDSGNEVGTSVHLHLSHPPRVEVGTSQGFMDDSFEPDSLEPGNERAGLRLDGLSSGRSSASSSKGSPDSLRGGGGGMTETEMSDWARDTDANSVGEDLEIELNIDPTKISVKEKRAKIAREDEFDDEYLGEYQNIDRDLMDVVIVPKQTAPPLVKLSAFLPNVDNIEFMDLGDSASSPDEASEARRNGYVKLCDDDNIVLNAISDNVSEASDAEKATESSDTTVSISGSTSQTPDTEFSPVEAVNRNLVTEEEESLLPETEDTTNSDVTTVVDTPKASNSGRTLENTLGSSKSTSKPHDSNMNTYDEYVQSLKGRISPFSNVRDSIDIRKSRIVPATPRTKELIALEREGRRFVNSPSTSRKLEEISKERTKQKDLIKELVMEKIGPRSVEKKNRRNSRGSLSPSGSQSPVGSAGPQSRQGSQGSLLSSRPFDELEEQCVSACNRAIERRVPPLHEDCLGSPDLYGVPFADDSTAEDSVSYSSKQDRYRTPMTSFKRPLQRPLSVPSKCPVAPVVKNPLPDTPLTNPEAFNVHARRDIFHNHNQSTSLSSSSHDVYKLPYHETPDSQGDIFFTPNLSTEDRSKVREEARARARLKSDRELGLSPAAYASSLKEKLHRKGSLTDVDTPQVSSWRNNVDALKHRSLIIDPYAFTPESKNALKHRSLIIDSLMYTPESKSLPVSTGFLSGTKGTFFLTTADDEMGKKRKPKEPERRRSIIQAVSDFFNKKKDSSASPSPPKTPTESPAKSSNHKESKDKFSRFRLAHKNKDKGKEKDKRRKSADECSLEPTPPPVPPLPQAYVDSGMTRRLSEDNLSDNDDDSKVNQSAPVHESCSSVDGIGSLSRRQSKMAQRIARQAELKRLRMAQELQRQFEELEVKQRVLEERGVMIEKALRGEETGCDREESELLQEWFEMMRERSELRRYEKELTVRIEELKLEDQRARLEQELRERMSKDEASKTESDVEKEGRILADMLEIVEKRDSLIAVLEEDRQRYQAEDKDLEAQMLKKGLQLTPIRKESHV